ncbi:InlB B-repeat-containing protein, partial [Candidatus Saccharibacteria bacterium]|nr:InlB B-repeat-containing protein [Candidatus Saccharibacteria bacterium]
GDILDTTTETDPQTNEYNLTFGVKTDIDTPAGTYNKTFTLTAVANEASYNVTFNPNAGTDTVTNMPTASDTTLSGVELTLPFYPTPTRSGYSFLGWDTNQDAIAPQYTSSNNILEIDPTDDNPIVLYAIWGCGDGYICYHENGADAGQGTMKQNTLQSSAYSAGSSQTLVAPNYSKTGYGFVGWSETPVSPDLPIADIKTQITNLAGDNKIYGPNQTITMPDPATPIELYAIWLPAEKDANNQPVYLQGWTGCSAMNANEVKVLTDSRDNNVYTITKIVNTTKNYSECWMTENLRIDAASPSVTINNSNTNYPASSFLAQKDAFSGDTWQGCGAESVACIDQISYSIANIDRNNNASHNANNQTSSWYAYGGMYNWFTATAGNGLYGMNSGSAVGDICPSGWRLPTGKPDEGDVSKLDAALGGNGRYQSSSAASNRWRTYPINVSYSGSYSVFSAQERGSAGRFRVSTAYNAGSTFLLDLGANIVLPGTNNGYGKYGGNAVRCLSGNPNYYIIYNNNGGTGYGDPQSLGTTAPNGSTEFTLIASNFSRANYGFAGWSTEPLDPTNANFATNLATAVSQNKVYGPNAQIKPSASNFDSNKELTLYAIWVPVEKDGNNQDLTFQSFNPEAAPYASRSNGDVIALRDTRDNEVYAVAKLADGNYWMIENLRLDPSDANTTITTSNTNHPTQAFIDDINTNYKGNSEATLWKNCTTEDSICIDQVSFQKINLTSNFSNPSYNYAQHGWQSYGIHYNWYTATGGTGTYNTTKNNGAVSGDICPMGWHLPYGGYDSDTGDRIGNIPGGFYYLNRMLNGGNSVTDATASKNLRSYPNNLIRSGYYYGTQITARGSTGCYSTNLAYNNGFDMYVKLTGSDVALGNDMPRGKASGTSIRCVANTAETFTLSYNANGGSGTPIQQTGSSRTHSFDFTISSTVPTRSDLSFAGWSTDQNATEESILYQPGQTYTFYQLSTALYAVWVPEVIIHFNSNGGTGAMTDQGVPANTSRTLRSNTFSKSGYGFSGWATAENSTIVEYTDKDSYTAPTVVGLNPLEVTLYAVWGRSRKIVYNINGGDDGTMSNQTGIYEYSKVTLWASNFRRDGYGFAGWSVDPDAWTHLVDNDLTNDPVIYGPNETIAVPEYADDDNTLTLYAVWVAPEQNITMQTFNPSDSTYSGKSIGSVIALNDSRDATNVYAIAKLADGNWWMIENLRLNPADPNTTINASNTNNPTSTFIDTDITLANITDNTGKKAYANNYFRTCNDMDSTNGPTCMDQISFGLGNITGTTSNRTSGDQASRWYSYGVMYNWYTATAGHGTYSKTSSDGNMPGDICPTGWHLGYGSDDANIGGGNTSGGFYYLSDKLGAITSSGTASSIKWREYPNNYIGSGSYKEASTWLRGNGFYWSGKANNNNTSYYMYMGTGVNPGTANSSTNKNYGKAVRCVSAPHYNFSLSLGANVASIEVDGVTYSSNTTLSLAENSTHTINMTFASGYEFDSWSISGTGASVASTSTQSTAFTMGSSDATLTASAKEVTFDSAYASAGKTKYNGYYKMQDMTATICSAVATGQTGTVIDTRDNQTYRIGKWKMSSDGSSTACWMKDNLNLGRYDFASGVTQLDNTNTNLPDDPTKFVSASTFAEWDRTTSPSKRKASYTDPKFAAQTTSDTYGNKYGALYNYAAASAGTYVYAENSGTGDAQYSLCPSSWRLPTGGNSGEFKELNDANSITNDAAGSTKLQSDFGFSSAGYFSDKNIVDQGSKGYYWSSTMMGSNAMYDMSIYPSLVATSNGYIRSNGASVRCIADNTPAESNQQSNEPEATPGSQEPSQQNPEPQSAPQQSYQSSYSAPMQAQTMSQQTNSEENTKDETKEDSSEETNTQPLGVNKELDEAVSSAANISNSDNTTSIFGTIAIVGAGIVTTTGLLLLAGKKREEDEEEQPKVDF